jgi:hypothetical protein
MRFLRSAYAAESDGFHPTMVESFAALICCLDNSIISAAISDRFVDNVVIAEFLAILLRVQGRELSKIGQVTDPVHPAMWLRFGLDAP